MKTKEELNKLKEEVDNLCKKLQELTNEELNQVAGGIKPQNNFTKGARLPAWDLIFASNYTDAERQLIPENTEIDFG